MPRNPAASDLTVEITWCGTLHVHHTKQGFFLDHHLQISGGSWTSKSVHGGRNRPGLFLEVPRDSVRHPHLCLLPSTLIKALMPFHLQHTGCIYETTRRERKSSMHFRVWEGLYSLHILLSNKNEAIVIKSINNYYVHSYIFVLNPPKKKYIYIFSSLYSFQLKLTIVAQKHQWLVFLCTQIMITGEDYQLKKTYFCVVPYTILCKNLKILLL